MKVNIIVLVFPPVNQYRYLNQSLSLFIYSTTWRKIKVVLFWQFYINDETNKFYWVVTCKLTYLKQLLVVALVIESFSLLKLQTHKFETKHKLEYREKLQFCRFKESNSNQASHIELHIYCLYTMSYSPLRLQQPFQEIPFFRVVPECIYT